MARLKVGRAVLDDAVTPIALDAVIDGPRPGRSDPAADRTWLDLRRQMGNASSGHPAFDLRRLLFLQTARERAVWLEGQRHWLATVVFANDPRVRF
jgi:hypothetical protein